jgi:hypothetical protein
MASIKIRMAFNIVRKLDIKKYSHIDSILATRQYRVYKSIHLVKIGKFSLRFDHPGNSIEALWKGDCIWSDTYPKHDIKGVPRPQTTEILPQNTGAFPEFDLKAIPRGSVVLLCGDRSSSIGVEHHERTMIEIMKAIKPDKASLCISKFHYEHAAAWRVHGLQGSHQWEICHEGVTLVDSADMCQRKITKLLKSKGHLDTVVVFSYFSHKEKKPRWAKNADFVFSISRHPMFSCSEIAFQAFDTKEDILHAYLDRENRSYRSLVFGPLRKGFKRVVFEYNYNCTLAELRDFSVPNKKKDVRAQFPVNRIA